MDVRKIKTLIELINSSDIAEIEIQEGEESVRISRQSSIAPAAAPAAPIAAAPVAVAATPAAAPSPAAAPAVHQHLVRPSFSVTVPAGAVPGQV